MGKIWAVSSGSGGVGKSTIALSLAAGAAKVGKDVIFLDTSGVSRSCDLTLGLESMVILDMADVISQQVDIESALYPVVKYPGLRFACASLNQSISCNNLSGIILALHSMCDILVVDMPTGQCDLGTGVMRKGDEHLIITRPDDASIRSAERILLQAAHDDASSSLVVNRVRHERNRRKMQHTQDVVQSVLNCTVLACIPEDTSISACEQKGRAAIECDGPAWTALRDLLQLLLSA